MNRTLRRKLFLYAAITLLVASASWLVFLSKAGAITKLGIATLLMLPGLVSSRLYPNVYATAKSLRRGEFERCVEQGTCALADLARISWKSRFTVFWFSVYTNRMESAVCINIAIAQLSLDHLAAAESMLKQAIAFDPLNPLAYYILSVLARTRGDVIAATAAESEAIRLGFKGGTDDEFVQCVEEFFQEAENVGIQVRRQDKQK